MKGLTEVGFLLIILGMILVAVSSMLQLNEQKKDIGKNQTGPRTNVAVGGFIGPIPFGFFSDKKMVVPFIGMVVFLIVIFLVMVYLTRHYFGSI